MSEKYCPKCGQKQDKGHRFCYNCGNKLEKEKSGSEKTGKISRRNFLKTAGLGAAGLGALSMLPSAEALTIKGNNPIKFLDGQGNKRHLFNQQVENKTDVSGNTTIDLSDQNAFYHKLTGDVTYSFVRAFKSPSGSIFSLVIEQDSNGRHDINWPNSVEWHQGHPPSITDAPNTKHEYSFRSYDGGNTWIGSLVASDIG